MNGEIYTDDDALVLFVLQVFFKIFFMIPRAPETLLYQHQFEFLSQPFGNTVAVMIVGHSLLFCGSGE